MSHVSTEDFRISRRGVDGDGGVLGRFVLFAAVTMLNGLLWSGTVYLLSWVFGGAMASTCLAAVFALIAAVGFLVVNVTANAGEDSL